MLIVLVEQPRQPGRLTYLPGGRGRDAPVRLGQLKELEQEPYGPVSTIRYKARDGLEIEAMLTQPKGGGKNLPLIVMPHGGPFARDEEKLGLVGAVPGQPGLCRAPAQLSGLFRLWHRLLRQGDGQWGLAMQDDLIDGIAWAAKQGIADPKRVCIVGGSYGGYAALRAAQRDHGVYRCAVSYAGVSDMAAILRHDASFLNGSRSKDYWRSQSPDLKGRHP